MRQPLALIIFLLTLLTSCGGQGSNVMDKPDQGTIRISVEESFKPVIEEQLHVYSLSNPKANITADYSSESDCIKQFLSDSSKRMIVISRPLTSEEEHYIKSKLGYFPETNAIASDAVTIIVNEQSKDSLWNIATLRDQMSGKVHAGKTFVMDGLKLTSTVRLIKEKLMGGLPFDTSVVKSARNTSDVIDYVGRHENAVGFVGFSWVGNMNDRAQQDSLKKIRIAYIQCDACENKPYVRPTQESIMFKRYPLVRNLYYILKENYTGLGSGFSSFMKYESGQLVFRKACLGPVMDFTVRTVKLNTKP